MKKNTGYPSIDKTHLNGTKYSERHPIIPNFSIVKVMELLWAKCPDDAAVSCYELKATHKELLEDSQILAKVFKILGIQKGDIICISMPNYYQGVASFVAANRIGAIVTFLNPYAQDEELIVQMNKYESPLLINYDKTGEYNNNLIEQTKLKHIITIQKGDEGIRIFPVSEGRNTELKACLDYRDLAGIAEKFGGGKNDKSHVDGNDDALILFTSGSTGNPKDMLFTNKNVVAACIYYKNSAHMEKYTNDNRRWMGVVPFMYPYGFAASVLSTLLAGREAMLAPNAGPDNLNEYLSKGPGLIFGSPAFLELMKRNIAPDLDLSSLHTFVSGGDFLSEQLSRSAIEFFREHNANVSIANGSGNGELLGCCTNSMNIEYRPETVGKLVNGPDFVVLDEDTGKEVKYNEKGVLCVAGENCFKEYYHNPELTNEVMIDFNGKKYYKTGNYGKLGEDGYFTLIGRSSRFFIINTLNKVYCELVQNIVSSIDVVESCAIVPKPNKEQLYESKAYVVLKKDVKPSKEIEEYIKKESLRPYIDSYGNSVSLKPYEIPYSITFLDIIPRTDADKVDYEGLKKAAEEEYNNEHS